MPNPEPITLHRTQTDGTFGSTAITHAFRRNVSRDEISYIAEVGQATQQWLIPAQLAGDEAIKVGDKITDSDGKEWFVRSYKSRMEHTIHEVNCTAYKR